MNSNFSILLRETNFRTEVENTLETLETTGDCTAIAIPVNSHAGSDFRLATNGLRDIPFGELSLPLPDALCAAVLERNEIVSVGNTAMLSRERTSVFMRAENFRAFLGAPLTIQGTEPEAVIAILSRATRDWNAFHIDQLGSVTKTIATLVRQARN